MVFRHAVLSTARIGIPNAFPSRIDGIVAGFGDFRLGEGQPECWLMACSKLGGDSSRFWSRAKTHAVRAWDRPAEDMLRFMRWAS